MIGVEPTQKKYYSIGEVCDLTGIKQHTIRYWEQQFPQLKPLVGRGDRRRYTIENINLIKEIQDLLHNKGYTIAGAKTKLRQPVLPSSIPNRINCTTDTSIAPIKTVPYAQYQELLDKYNELKHKYDLIVLRIKTVRQERKVNS